MPALDWLTARPVAHRGLHDATAGVIENTPSAVSAAIAGNYAIEVDLQLSADGEAIVHHDYALGRLTEGEGELRSLSTTQLKAVSFKATADRIMTLGDLLDLVSKRVTLILELKSRFDGDRRLADRVAHALKAYAGPVAAMSFDPYQVAVLSAEAPALTRGIIAERYPQPAHGDEPESREHSKMDYVLAAFRSRPNFLAYHVKDLPSPVPFLTKYIARLPLLTWTVRTPEDRERAARWADQMIFEGFRP
jgi:glycerophosphoryl diester phosphodiesterase